jgi:hypothetical protein
MRLRQFASSGGDVYFLAGVLLRETLLKKIGDEEHQGFCQENQIAISQILLCDFHSAPPPRLTFQPNEHSFVDRWL